MVNKIAPEVVDENSFFGPTEALIAFQTQRVYIIRHTLSNVLTLFAILLSFVTLVVLISENMFNRVAISMNAQTTDQYWTPYEQSCKLSTGGFLADSCGVEIRNSTTPKAWNTIGIILAEQWAREIATNHILFVTTCIIGGIPEVGWASLQIIVGYQDYPNCLPVNGAQQVAGLAMLETTVRDTHTEGLYFLTLYADLNPSMQTIVNTVNSDGTTAKLLSNPFQILVSMDGQRVVDSLGQNYIVHSYPMGPRYTITKHELTLDRYQVTAFCWTVIEELGDFISSLNGWSQGKYSNRPIVLGWNCGHEVKNSSELIVFQLLAFATTCYLLSGDIYISLVGIRNLLCGRPVMTYRILDGLERRKCLTGMITLNAVSSLLYLDVARIYYFAQNGYKIWLLSLTAAVFGTFAVSLVVTSIYRRLKRESVLLSTNWCFFNGFLARANPPILLTSLPLDEISRVEHKDHIICHPSILIHLGFATIAPFNEVNKSSHDTASKHEVFVISVYSLIPALLLCKACLLTPRVLGFISNGKFTPVHDTFLDRKSDYCYVEGTHVH
ncbi:hypothetical protein THRCLA_04695 [Thraustotheca clavata]|uniref:Transmembrane protein n=1 Tax=Thraustotheca clavata TaxID=74557 RepID=A0A1V9ZYE3_9STRA|nr:hypothetical protein THRCLA_04695 [Thraustotheca clavata]